jgi:hypothetical protein
MEQSKADELYIDKALVEIRKMQEETKKYIEESKKMTLEQKLTYKKVQYFEFSIMMAIIVATVTMTKLFL